MTSCTFDYLNRDLYGRIFNTSLVIGGFVLPFTAIISSYTLLFCLMRSRKKFLTMRGTMFKKSSKTKKSKNSSIKKEIQTTSFNRSFLRSESTRYERSSTSIISIGNFIERRQHPSLLKGKKTSPLDSFVRSQFKVARKTILMVFMFYLGWGPYAFLTLFAQYSANPNWLVNPYTATLSAVFAKTLVFLNPIVYTIIFSKFKVFFLLNFTNYLRSLRRKK